MNFVIFVNHDIAIGSVKYLIERELLKGIVMPTVQQESNLTIQTIASNNHIPYIYVDRKELHTSLAGWLEDKKPDAIFVQTFPYVIPERILEIPKFGVFNWHTGVLPQYRGPDPVFWEILNGESEGGVTLHQMNARLDEGDIIRIENVPIGTKQTHGEHYKELENKMISLTQYLTDMLVIDPSGIESVPQDSSKARYYKDPELKDLYICWKENSAEHIEKLTRATNPAYGGARTIYGDKTLHIFEAHIAGTLDRPAPAGTVVSENGGDELAIASKDGLKVALDAVYCKEGFYTGRQFAKNFGVKKGVSLEDHFKK